MVEHDFYKLINEKDKARNSLKTAVETLTVCPQCALNYADSLFEIGSYTEVIPIVEKAVNIREDQPSISVGYAYYILALSREYVLRNNNTILNQNNIKPVFDAYYSALEFLEDRFHFGLHNSFLSNSSYQRSALYSFRRTCYNTIVLVEHPSLRGWQRPSSFYRDFFYCAMFRSPNNAPIDFCHGE